MAITPRYGWELADGPDAPNVPFYLRELALDVEATVGGVEDYWTQLGIAGFRIEARTVVQLVDPDQGVTVNFAGAFTAPPIVVAIPGDVSALNAANPLYVTTVTTTSFDAYRFNAGETVRLNYIAIGPTAQTARATGTVEPFITYEVQP